ncbi:E3 ubiquitin-protein ligase TRIM11-like isoform X2 [Hirundo rustica]|uniref:E3 ubiquitin-protein ligase TRIM11-like isoform X2 n=1 Tax=Hirundo rustica TaxID=43150 RepID=UPI001A93D716|nr:E3 ubiquitin-protein ligase TRIM11-like isoform X2 [Hirundo rustica]
MGEPAQAVVMKTFGGRDETCKEKIQSHLQSLRKVLTEFLDWRVSEEKRHQDYLEMSEAERRRIQAEFERLRRLLAEQERTVLGRLAELDDTFAATHAEKSLRVAEGVAQVHRLIGQLEARCLTQDVGSILSSEMRLHLPSGLPKELEKSLSSCCRQSDALWEALEKFRALLETPVRGDSHPRRGF